MIKVYSHTEHMNMLREAARQVTATRESRVEFFQSVGVYDKHGNLAPRYK